MITAYLEGQATLIGGLEVLRISDSPFTDELPRDRIRTTIPATREQIIETSLGLFEGERFFL